MKKLICALQKNFGFTSTENNSNFLVKLFRVSSVVTIARGRKRQMASDARQGERQRQHRTQDRPAAEAEQPAAPREVEAGPAAGPASQGQSLGQPPVPEEAGLSASSSTTGAVKWPRVRTEPEQAPQEPRVAPADETALPSVGERDGTFEETPDAERPAVAPAPREPPTQGV